MLEDLERGPVLPPAQVVCGTHKSCPAAHFCADHYVDDRIPPCRSLSSTPGAPEGHQTCAARDFCVDYYIGAAQKPCRPARGA